LTPDENLRTSDLATAETGANESPSASDHAAEAPGGAEDSARQTALFSDDDSSGFRERWMDIQTGFVDEPRQAVEQADALVAELMKRLAQTFADERAKLEAQWGQGDNVGTEELRVALQRYRSFFERLLST
jgi:hypothetical protein